MKRSIFTVSALAIATGILSADAADRAAREMNVQQGPDSIFPNPVETIFPELEGAVETGRNGRVGNELVFWEHRYADGREVYLVACARIGAANCRAREEKVCPGPAEVLARTAVAGLVTEVQCMRVALTAPGDTRPGCTERERTRELAVSLLQCL